VQRVNRASVTVDGQIVGRIERGLLVYVAAAPDDGDADLGYIADKVAHLRIFPDADGRMNLDVTQIAGANEGQSRRPGVLLVSAFTVLADARKGRRPSFDASADGPAAEPLIARLADAIRAQAVPVETGRFAAYMQVECENDGPICIVLDSRRIV
jgi:D-tyrosyl-tRNA(Tyr) deacylase